MATGNIVPNGDVLNQWTAHSPEVPPNAHHNIDEGPGHDANNITGGNLPGDDNEVEVFNFTTIADIGEVTQVVVWVYGRHGITYPGGSPEVNLYIGGWLGEDELTPLFTTSDGWHSKTYSGLSKTQADLDGLQVQIRADVGENKNDNIVFTIYCAITYTVAGYTAGNPLGVAIATVASVMGVAKADIASIKGV